MIVYSGTSVAERGCLPDCMTNGAVVVGLSICVFMEYTDACDPQKTRQSDE